MHLYLSVYQSWSMDVDEVCKKDNVVGRLFVPISLVDGATSRYNNKLISWNYDCLVVDERRR